VASAPTARALAPAALLLLTGGLLGPEDAVVRSAQPLGPYLEVRLSSGTEGTLLLPATGACAGIARPEARVAWVQRGFPGRLEGPDGARCEAAGIGDLAAWRDRRPRPGGPPLPRSTARWEVIHRDGRRGLLRGRFRLAGLVGMPGGDDLVAVVADDGSCEAAFHEDEGSLEYRASGQPAFRLIVGGARCPVLGFARPPAPRG